MAARGFGEFGVRIAIPMMTAQQIAGTDLAIENPFRAGLAFAVLQAKFGRSVFQLSNRETAGSFN